MTAPQQLSKLVSCLQTALASGLPGPPAQALLAPRPRQGWRPGDLPDDCRQAAALLLLYTHRQQPTLLLTLRRHDLDDHAGQVSLPGGSLEDGETFAQAALREASEEVGLETDRARLLGALTPLHIPASGFHLHSLIGVTDTPDQLRASNTEVDRLIHCPVADLACSETQRTELWQVRGRLTEVPFFAVADLKVWGATAMVLAEFLTLIGCPPSPASPDRARERRGDTLGAPEDASPVEIIR